MMILVLAFLMAQEVETEKLLDRLGHDDPAVREKAGAALTARGPAIVPAVLALHRSTPSAEVRERTATLLQQFPFPAFIRTRPDEEIRQILKTSLLPNLSKHREVADCMDGKRKLPAIDVERLRILRQSGSGHGQFFTLDEITPDGKKGLLIRRVAYQRPTPYRRQIKEEGVQAEETRLSPEEADAIVDLLGACRTLRPSCAIPQDPQRHWMSTGDFTMRFRIDSGAETVWAAGYTGYPGSLNEPEYAHGKILDEVLEVAFWGRSWTSSTISADDRARCLRWMTDHFEREGWWVKEHYLNAARFVGDESYLPFLGKVAKEVEDRTGPSETRQLKAAKEAVSQITSARK